MRDKRSIQIKKLLRKKYPYQTCRVRIDKYSLGETIYVYTDAWPDIHDDSPENVIATRQNIRHNLEVLLKDFLTQESTYLHICCLRRE
jgi:hypothetical protein